MSATVFWNASTEIATCANTFEVNGVPTDPTVATLTVTDPAGMITTYTGGQFTHTPASGVYTVNVPCSSTVTGIWTGIWTGTGAASDAAAFTWTTWPTDLRQYYCSTDELKSRLGVTGTVDDAELLQAVTAASRAVDEYCDRYFYRATDTRTYIPWNLYETRIDDVVTVTALATDPSGTAPSGGTFPVSWPAGSFQLLPYNPGKRGEVEPYTRIRAVGGLTFPWITPLLLMRMDRVQVTGVFGWPQVPQAVHAATLIMAADLFRLKDAPFGVAGFGEFGAVRITANPRVAQLLAAYRRSPFLAA